ncbi:cGMP-specific 3', partial [Dinothrombium tinctorium]
SKNIFQKQRVLNGHDYRLYNFDFSDFGLSENETCLATIRMFMDLRLIRKFHIPYQGNNILQFLSPEDYKLVIGMIESAILSTDLEQYFQKKDKFIDLVRNGEEWEDINKRELLRGMMMTACDVSATTKPWRVQKKIAELVASEFFHQGDLEKQLKKEPLAMMDRERRHELPLMQVEFIDVICLPVYKIFAECWHSLKQLYDGCISNRQHWQRLIQTSTVFHMLYDILPSKGVIRFG